MNRYLLFGYNTNDAASALLNLICDFDDYEQLYNFMHSHDTRYDYYDVLDITTGLEFYIRGFSLHSTILDVLNEMEYIIWEEK